MVALLDLPLVGVIGGPTTQRMEEEKDAILSSRLEDVLQEKRGCSKWDSVARSPA